MFVIHSSVSFISSKALTWWTVRCLCNSISFFFTFHLFLSLPVCLCSFDITIQSFSSLSFSIPIVFNKWKQNRWLLTILNANEKDNGAEKLIFVSFAIHFHSTSFHSIGIALRANQPKTVTLSSNSSINNKKIQSCHCSFYFSARFEPH